MFFFTPGGASYVTLSAVSSRIGGNLACGSVVSQQRKFSCGVRFLISFSSSGTQLMTRCRFFRHTQSPFLAASCSSRSASSFCPPPIAIWWKFMLGQLSLAYCWANSSSSCDGSAPGVVTKRTGSLLFVSPECSLEKLSGGGDSDDTPIASHTNWVSADSRRSGRTAWMSRTRWKDDMREKMEESKDSSHLSEAAQGDHSWSLLSCQTSSVRGKAARSVCSAVALSGGHQSGAPPEAWFGGMYVP
mmetsp:Transcript_85690/g.220585  ORF Transcript_85690/g.220585 Transcript_85690/m.220585 type:complete len:245 (+) Transcript_85690:1710-2444(+)